jgi:hypothetical protein
MAARLRDPGRRPTIIAAERRLDDALDMASGPISNVHADRRLEPYAATPNSRRRRLTWPGSRQHADTRYESTSRDR